MDDSLIKAGLAIGGAIGGAIIAGLANAYAARQRIREIEISYSHKLRDGYLENARKMAADVYIPISIAIGQLLKSYDQFRANIDFDNNQVPTGSRNSFLGQCRNYLLEIDRLFSRGADAYLTNELDSTLRKFNSFVNQSLNETAVSQKIILEAFAQIPFLGNFSTGKVERTIPHRTLTRFLPTVSTTLIPGISISYASETLSAPLHSREFEERFQTEAIEIKALIKEVILGSHRAT
ncbi:hypothetical protein [Undibacter mobilis]|uniref:Uncharacterized protein n=1 Tax=Undibacter mobilis TaxID=2292256 RepID=A0A371BCX5_9BRAD|nr:hypothetical protein [Undibacter mobilis]RDV05459.1 hypothetical protein DXH78_13265 [Undibacter mobilis]